MLLTILDKQIINIKEYFLNKSFNNNNSSEKLAQENAQNRINDLEIKLKDEKKLRESLYQEAEEMSFFFLINKKF